MHCYYLVLSLSKHRTNCIFLLSFCKSPAASSKRFCRIPWFPFRAVQSLPKNQCMFFHRCLYYHNQAVQFPGIHAIEILLRSNVTLRNGITWYLRYNVVWAVECSLKYHIDYPMRISRLVPIGGQILFPRLDAQDRQFAFEVTFYHLQ